MDKMCSVCRDVRELPISETIKEFYQKNNASFSDSECATIIWNSSLPLSEKLTSLREIHDTTGDTDLKAQIQARLDLEAETERAFMSRSNNYIHMVQLDDDKDADSVFASVEAAILHGKENCEETFNISKVVLKDTLDPNTEDNVLLGGEARFKKDGALISCDIYYSREMEFLIVNAVTPASFEDAYISVLNPFEYGDIVRIMGDSRPAVVTTSQQDWQRRKEHLKKSWIPLNYETNSLTVEFLFPDGEFSHGHPHILCLEKLENWENEKEWKLLQAIQDVMLGNGSIELMFERYEANKEGK